MWAEPGWVGGGAQRSLGCVQLGGRPPLLLNGLVCFLQVDGVNVKHPICQPLILMADESGSKSGGVPRPATPLLFTVLFLSETHWLHGSGFSEAVELV